MVDFFKTIGRGILLVLIAPFAVVFFTLYSVYAIILFIVLFFIAVPKYLKGGSLLDYSELDKKAADNVATALKNEQSPQQAQFQPQQSLTINYNQVTLPGQPQPGFPIIDPSHISGLINSAQQVKDIEAIEPKKIEMENNEDVN